MPTTITYFCQLPDPRIVMGKDHIKEKEHKRLDAGCSNDCLLKTLTN